MMMFYGIEIKEVNISTKSGIDEKFFINCQTPESAYILGFIWGDGYILKDINKSIFKLSIECVEEDLKTIEEVFNKAGKWTRATRTRINRKPSLLLTVSNKKLIEYLESKNYLIKSGANAIILDDIEYDLQKYWWRGYLDADGCIYYNKNLCSKQLCFTSTYDQDWTFCENSFKNLNIKYTIRRTKELRSKSKSSKVRVSTLDICKLCEYIYSGESFGFKRKYDKYLLIKNHFKPRIVPKTYKKRNTIC